MFAFIYVKGNRDNINKGHKGISELFTSV